MREDSGETAFKWLDGADEGFLFSSTNISCSLLFPPNSPPISLYLLSSFPPILNGSSPELPPPPVPRGLIGTSPSALGAFQKLVVADDAQAPLHGCSRPGRGNLAPLTPPA